MKIKIVENMLRSSRQILIVLNDSILLLDVYSLNFEASH